MLMEIIEKKGQPIKTRIKFSKKEYNSLSFNERVKYSENFEIHETARQVYFDVEGDLLNAKKK